MARELLGKILDKLTDQNHPIWKLSQTALSLMAGLLLLRHMEFSSHHGLETTDALGGILGLKTLADLRHYFLPTSKE